MSGYKDILKKGWHPEKEGSTLKGRMVSSSGQPMAPRQRPDDTMYLLVPPEKPCRSRRQQCTFRQRIIHTVPRHPLTFEQGNQVNHAPRPLSSLQDPASFGPPPVRNPPISRPSSTANSSPLASPIHPTNASAIGEPLAPPNSSRADTSLLPISHPPLPPPRREIQPPPLLPSSSKPTLPSLPPILPPRNPAPPPALASSVQAKNPTSSGLLNHGAINRLSAAGISVPGFGIRTGATNQSARGSAPPPPPTRSMPSSAQIGELSSRFPRLGMPATSASTSASGPGTGVARPPVEGTTFEQKKAALRTAATFRENPGSVSLSDARAAASTANNFRQRHGDQVAAGLKEANKLNDKYGGRLGNDGANDGIVPQADCVLSTGSLLAKKKPPPPPPRKPQAPSAASEDDTPPIPLATRPRF